MDGKTGKGTAEARMGRGKTVLNRERLERGRERTVQNRERQDRGREDRIGDGRDRRDQCRMEDQGENSMMLCKEETVIMLIFFSFFAAYLNICTLHNGVLQSHQCDNIFLLQNSCFFLLI